MKKFLLILASVILLVPQLALAATLKDTLNAPEHYIIEPFSTATGKSVFTIDAEVFVPDIAYNGIPVYEVALYSFTEEEIHHMATVLGYDASKMKKEIDKPTRPWHFDWTRYEISDKNSTFSAGVTFNQYTGKNKSTVARYDLTPGKNRPIYTYPINGSVFPITSNLFGGGNDLETATQLALEIAAKLAPELSLNYSGITSTDALVTAEQTDRWNLYGDIELPRPEDMPFTYIFFFTRVLDGIPVTYTNENGSGTDEMNTEAYTDDFYQYERLSIVVADEGIGSMAYESPYEIKGVWKEDAGELLSFEQIMQIAKTMLPLKYASNERDTLKLVDYRIHHITFGLTRVMMPNEPEREIMVPVWDIFGTTSYLGDDGTTSNFFVSYTKSLLTINAVTGSIIDRALGY